MTGKATKFWHPGDPVAHTGWVDSVGGDKRLLISSGPFAFADGDTQEVVGGIIIAQGQTPLESVTLLKRYDLSAQSAYDLNFAAASAPPGPQVNVFPDTAAIVLSWDNVLESHIAADRLHLDASGKATTYTFQGYNVYQLEAPALTSTTTVKKIAGFDVIDGVVKIRDDVIDPATGYFVNRVVQDARDTGLQRFWRVAKDALADDAPLVRNQPYYFAVTGYIYNPVGVPKTYESPLQIITARPQSLPLGTRVAQLSGDTLAVRHISQGPILSDGKVYPIVVDPLALADHTYKITFRMLGDTMAVWNVTDSTTGELKVLQWKNQGRDGAENFPVVDGLLFKLFGPPLGINSVTFNRPAAEHWLTGVNWGGEFFNGGIGLGKNFFGSNIKSDEYVTVEIRFRTNADGQRAYGYLRGSTPNYGFISYERQHFTAWDVTANPPRQINVAYVEQAPEQNNLWDPGVQAARNYLFILNSTYSDTPDPYYTSRNALANAKEFDTMYAFWPVLREGFTAPAWRDGQVLTIRPNFINTPQDVFTFKSIAPIRHDRELARRQAAKLVNVFPNPYDRSWLDLQHPADQFVMFTHLPEGRAKILIYTLSADWVRTIEHTNGTQFERWDLRNAAGRQVGSGIYIVYIDMGEIGVKTLKLVIF